MNTLKISFKKIMEFVGSSILDEGFLTLPSNIVMHYTDDLVGKFFVVLAFKIHFRYLLYYTLLYCNATNLFYYTT